MAPLPRSTLQKLATDKLADANLLIRHGRHSNASYLYGYAIELAIKACIARQLSAETIPDRRILTGFLSHRLNDLIGLAGLRPALDERRKDREFDSRWADVSEWSEEA